MPKFAITGMAQISIFATIEADTKAAALEQANQMSLRSLCHYCSSEPDGDTFGVELDGEPQDLQAIKLT